MNFCFPTGDGGIPEPYFYATAYPLPPAHPSIPLLDGVVWHNQGWQGAVMAMRRRWRTATRGSAC